MRTMLLALIGWLVLAGSVHGAAPSQSDYDRFFAALHQVESNGARDGQAPKGDSGKAVGPLQIWKAYWSDSRVPGSYSRCNQLGYSRRVVEAYLQRYAAAAWATGDWQTLARTHNGGPKGPQKPQSKKYWLKVQKLLD